MNYEERTRFIRVCRRIDDAVLHVDTSACAKIPTQFVLVGKQGRRDYVRVFEFLIPTMLELTDLLAEVAEYGVKTGRIDAPCDIGDMVHYAIAKRDPRRK
jgi:hypothetical protein